MKISLVLHTGHHHPSYKDSRDIAFERLGIGVRAFRFRIEADARAGARNRNQEVSQSSRAQNRSSDGFFTRREFRSLSIPLISRTKG